MTTGRTTDGRTSAAIRTHIRPLASQL